AIRTSSGLESPRYGRQECLRYEAGAASRLSGDHEWNLAADGLREWRRASLAGSGQALRHEPGRVQRPGPEWRLAAVRCR
ncbi:MAG: hypothetical protein WCT12_28510, partial [Verrucomicrobiota bacterium]